MTQQMIDKYNPTKFRELNQSEIEAMRSFTMDDIADLAKAYPNKPSERAYLVLYNKQDQAKQLYPLATWVNVLALWKQGSTNYVPFNFASLHNSKSVKGMDVKVGPVQDLTNAEVKRELKTWPGKSAAPTKLAIPDPEDEEDDDDFKIDQDSHETFDPSLGEENFEDLEAEASKPKQVKGIKPKPVKRTRKKIDKSAK